ncbi:hypothetical protein FQR65_LT05961 [Abscondita terminalis]|nr:hypothetical protein FQR65_LT05961 [Abscondita terminalis]
MTTRLRVKNVLFDETKNSRIPQVAISVLWFVELGIAGVCLGPLVIGVSISWTSPVLPQLQSNSSIFHLTNNEVSWLAPMLGFGVLTAALPTGYLASTYGIKKCAVGLTIPMIIFTVLTATASNVYVLCLARFFCGIANGGVCVISPMYMSEISDIRFRGTLGSFFEFLIYVGVIFVAVCGSYVNYITLTITIGVICALLSSIFVFLPESPTYLLKINKRDEAERSVKFYTSNPCDVVQTMVEIQNNLENKHHQLSISQAFRSKAVIRALTATVGLTVFQKFCGIDCVLFYAVNIFQETKSGLDPYTSSMILAGVQLTSAVLIVFVVELADRRVFLYASTIGMGLSLTVLATYFQLKQYGIGFTGFGYFPLASLIVYAFMFSVGLGPILWMINGELFAPNVKGLANGITMTSNWGLNCVVTKFFPIIMERIGPNYTFYTFAVCMFACAVFVRFFVHETRVQPAIGEMFHKLQHEKNLVGKLKQIVATICIGPLIIGVSVSWTSPVLPQLQSNSSTFHLTNNEASWLAPLLGFGVLTAAIPTGYLASTYGIKKCAIGLTIPMLIFTILTVTTNNVYVLYLARFFCGIANGGVCVISPMYMSEISDVRFRGTLGSFFEFLIYVGVVFVAVCGSYVDYITLTITIGILCFTLSSIFIILPESPTFLLKINKEDEAEKALRFYTGNLCDVTYAMNEIKNNLESKHQQLSISQAFRSKAVVRGLIATVGLTIFQKFCGIDCVVFYAVNIFQETKAGFDAYTSSMILAAVQLITAILVVFVVELANRRVFLYVSTIGMGLSLAALATYFQLKQYGISFPGFAYLPLASLIVYAFMFSVGLGPILWMINGELFAPNVKGLANGIIMTSNWGFLSIVTKFFPIVMERFGPNYTFYTFSLCMFACAAFIRFFVHETRGKSLEQIQIELSS